MKLQLCAFSPSCQLYKFHSGVCMSITLVGGSVYEYFSQIIAHLACRTFRGTWLSESYILLMLCVQ